MHWSKNDGWNCLKLKLMSWDDLWMATFRGQIGWGLFTNFLTQCYQQASALIWGSFSPHFCFNASVWCWKPADSEESSKSLSPYKFHEIFHWETDTTAWESVLSFEMKTQSVWSLECMMPVDSTGDGIWWIILNQSDLEMLPSRGHLG